MNGPSVGKGRLKFSNQEIIKILKKNDWKCSDCGSQINDKNNSPFPPNRRKDLNWVFDEVETYGLAKYNDIHVKKRKTRGTPNNTKKNSKGALNFENLRLLCKSCYINDSKEVSISFRTSKNKREFLEKVAKSKEITLTKLMNEIVDKYRNRLNGMPDEEFLKETGMTWKERRN